MKDRFFFVKLCFLWTLYHRVEALSTNNNIPIVSKIQNDFLALTRRSTTRHILLPKSNYGYDAALLLKQKIRNRVGFSSDGSSLDDEDSKDTSSVFIVDVFEAAAKKFSIDKETAINGGLLGTLVPQGYCICQELDKASFTEPLGIVSGPIESKFGYHLVLVCERTNCPKLDNGFTKIIPPSSNDDENHNANLGFALSNDLSSIDESDDSRIGTTKEIIMFSLQQIGFWLSVTLAGGIVAELSAKAAGVIDKLPWQG